MQSNQVRSREAAEQESPARECRESGTGINQVPQGTAEADSRLNHAAETTRLMVLARIITRSHACSRELALDLLARGYAVEIVSPDSIPDNIADLELRVETDPGNQLIASVEAHDGDHSASLEFLHHLKAPMVDFIRRPPDPREAAYLSKEPVGFNAELRLAEISVEDVELPAEAPQPAAKAVSRAAEIPLHPDLDPRSNIEESARSTTPVDSLPSLPAKPPSHSARQAAEIAPPIAPPIPQPTTARPTMLRPTITAPPMLRPVAELRRRDRSAGWLWRAALGFATVALLALVLGFGLRRTGKAPAQISGAAPAERVAAPPADVDLLSAVNPEKAPERTQGEAPAQVAASAVSSPALRSEGRSEGSQAPDELPVAKPGAATARAGVRPSSPHRDDLIARDTVTYLDERYRPVPKAKAAKRFARRHPSSRPHRGDVIAANSVAYLDTKPTPKAAKQTPGTKRPSNQN